MTLDNLETRALPSAALADDRFVGPRLSREWLAQLAAAPGTGPTQRPDFATPGRGNPPPTGYPATVYAGPSGDQVAAAPAFDAATGRALPGNKSRVDDPLLELFNAVRDRGADWQSAGFTGSFGLMLEDATHPYVHITARDVGALLPPLAALGLRATYADPANHVIEGSLPVASLPAVERLNSLGLMGVLAVQRPETDSGAAVNQADWVSESERLRQNNTTLTGTGVRVGVLSDSYNTLGGAAADIAAGELPSTVTVLSGQGGNGKDEGRAMLQLIHDVAPGAALAFATANGGEGNYAANIRRLANPADGNCSVIVDDVPYATEPYYQPGLVQQTVQEVVTTRNVVYFASAGNRASRSYESPRWLTTNTTVAGILGDWYDFDTGGNIDSTQRLTVPADAKITLPVQWDQPFFTTAGVTTDIDVFLLRGDTGAVVASATSVNTLSQSPMELINYTNNTGQTAFDLAIRLYSGPAVGRFKYINFGDAVTIAEYNTASPAINAHSGSFYSEAVGALPYFNHTTPESFTSKGPRTEYFDAAGNRLSSPFVINNPRIAAADGCNTSFFDDDADGDGFGNFFGTSAAAPNAAAVAALVRQANPTMTPADVARRLEFTADDTVGAVGYDDLTGSGLINAFKAVTGFNAVATPTYATGFEGALDGNWETYTTGAGRVQVRNNAGPAGGSFHLTLDTQYGQNPATTHLMASLNEAVLHVNLAGTRSARLTFNEREWSDDDHAMPASFTGHGNYDGVAFSANGSTWYRLVSLAAASSTNTYQAFSFDLVAAAASAGVALSADTRIKFQRYGDDSINPGTNVYDGIGFDDIVVTRGGQFTGRQVNDADGDGAVDAGEAGLPGWVVYNDANANGRLDRGNAVARTTAAAVALPDLATVNVPFAFSGLPGIVTGVEVALDITHTYDGDLSIFLISPGGTSVQLFDRHGGGGDNFFNTTFADDAFTPVAAGGAPFGGRYRPAAPLAAFNGLIAAQANGTWTVRIVDNASGDFGTLNTSTVTLFTAPFFTATTAVTIPDFVSTPTGTTFRGPSTVFAPLAVSGVSGPLSRVSVNLNATHSYDGDLTFFLVAPNGARVQLFDRHGGSADNFSNTTFDDFAATAIAAGTAPFSGAFRPTQPLGLLTGLSGAQVNGTWFLEIHDNAGGDTGTLTNWSLRLETGDSYAVTDANGEYALNNQTGSPAAITEQHPPGQRPTFPAFGVYYIPDFANGANFGSGNFLVQTDATAPTVASIAPVGPAVTNAGTVQFTVTFSEAVARLTGLTTGLLPADNFLLQSSGLTGAGITNVTGSGTTYTVTVSTGTGDGSLTLSFNNSINVVDQGYNAVANLGAVSGSVTVDRTPPAGPAVQVNDGNAQRSAVRSLRVTFGEVITFVGAGSAAFQLTDNNNVAVPGVALAVSPIDNSTGSSVVTITFGGAPIIGGSLADGRYRLRTLASQVRDAAGNGLSTDAVFSFHRLYGDVTGDATVNAADFGPFRNAFGTSTGNPLYRDFLDYNFDGTINALDFGQFRQRFGVTLP